MRAIVGLLAGVLLGPTGLGGASALAQSSASGPAALEVPYLAQTTLLCGGAAAAMVERWWGRRGVYAEDFSALVRVAEGGIRTTDLVSAVRARGWDASLLPGTPAAVQLQLRSGTPVVALIEVGPARYHYVVVLRWDNGQVLFHDPADAPSVSLDEADFLTRWAGADRWALVIRPGSATSPAPPLAATAPIPVDPLPCHPWLDRAVDAAAADALDEAGRLLGEAARFCPTEPLVLREQAAIQFRRGDQTDAARLATEYLTRVPDDSLGWQLLATARYLSGDREGALDAWNEMNRPIVDLVRIDGLRRIRFGVTAAALALPHGVRLTRPRLALARRRAADVP
ncbi:MAG: C39 family peptidase, partial [Gemmatimonadales bacterium]